jgi:type IV pilus assembly protein PilQ
MMIKQITRWTMAILTSFALMTNLAIAEEESNKIEKIDFSGLSGGRVLVTIKTTSPLKNPPAGFTLKSPPRIALDFPNTISGLSQNLLTSEQGVLKSVNVAQSKNRTRLVMNLSKVVAYSTEMSGNETKIIMEANEQTVSPVASTTRFAEPKLADQTHAISNVDFARGKNGEGRVVVDLSDAATGINIRQQGKKIVVDFINTDLPAKLERRLNVTNFNTPVLYVDTLKQGKNTRIVIEPQGNWEQSAYQADKKFIVDVRRIIEDPTKLVQGSKAGYTGEKLSLNFQNIDVRSVLQVIADFTGLNIVTSETVSGNLTLRLKDVPWDQALDIVMQSKGLSMRKTGNVVWVAPSEEVAAKEKQTLEANQQIEDLEQLRTEIFTLKYQKAEAFKNILKDGKESILSKRGSAVIDPRTNTLFVQDTGRILEEVQRIINKTDVPVRQVMIESRLVIADEQFGRSLGARFGIAQRGTGGQNVITTSGTLGNRFTRITNTAETLGNQTGSTVAATTQGNALIQGVSSSGEQDLNVNLPVIGATSGIGFSLFRLPAGLLLNLELTALERDLRGKVISSPRVTTGNQQKAIIEQGTELPYLQASSSGATSVAFKDAVLKLEVTPQITPDEKVIMDLLVKKDRVGEIFSGIPSIDTQKVKTQVLVSNGETIVLGGIYEEIERNDVNKVPFFGDIPVIGNLFKNTAKSKEKTELLIFVTPKIMDESLNVR